MSGAQPAATRAAADIRIGLSVTHRLLWSLTWVFGVLLLVAVADIGARRVFAAHHDRRQGHRQRFLVRLALRVAGAAAILLIVFGVIWLSDRAKGGYKPEQL